MRRPLDRRSPAAGDDRALIGDVRFGGRDKSENSLSPRLLQALRLQNRFGMSEPVARLVGELHFGYGDQDWEHLSAPVTRVVEAIAQRQRGRP
jgi:hypothetical protein